LPRGALAIAANVADGASIAILTGLCVGCVYASRIGVAAIIGAGIVVRAVERDTWRTTSIHARVPNGTRITIVTGEPLTRCLQSTFPRIGVAEGSKARRIAAFRSGASDHRLGIDDTEEGHLAGVANQDSITEVAIFQCFAVDIHLAIARNWRAGTGPLKALVCQAAWVAVVAVEGIVRVEASPRLVAGIVSTQIVIVAIDSRPDALATVTMVGDGAWVPIETLGSREGLMDAPILPLASIIGAAIVVIAKLGQLPFEEARFIDIPITIVIYTVAWFGCCLGSITLR
jgi:hypothetical protein